jgi:hypothetical protein
MNEPKDDLREIWQGGGSAAADVEGVLKLMRQKSTEFQNMITRRDLRETVGGVVIAVLFGWFAYRASDWLVRASDVWIAAAGLWIIYWLRRNSIAFQEPSRDQSLSAYYRALYASYERQVWLLSTAKLWYVLPVWSGLMLFSFATWRIQHNTAGSVVLIFTFTATFGFVWWLNESWGVRYLRRKQAELAEMVKQGEGGSAC